MSIKACIFDLGETLMSIPSGEDEEIRLSKLLNIGANEVRTVVSQICESYPGQSLEAFYERFDEVVNPLKDKALEAGIRVAWHECIQSARLSYGALDFLDALRASGKQLALVSNTPPFSHLIIDRLDLRRRFDVVVFSCDVGFSKPDPRIFRIVLSTLGVGAQEVVVFGDRIRTDILAGAILGTRSILVETRARKVIEDGRSYVDAIVPNLPAVFSTKFYSEELL
jgi:HAD superfamily hydrolase (TIGR01509 family)